MGFVSAQQLRAALGALSSFRDSVNKQRAQHILPYLALRQKGVSDSEFTPYSESDDFAFFNSYARVRGGPEPYFDPVAGRFRIATHPHSNVATMRKSTFNRTWDAATLRVDGGQELWKLEPGYVDIIRDRVLTKGGRITLVPALALGAFLLRDRNLDNVFTGADLAAYFVREFKLSEHEFENLFAVEATFAPFGAVGKLTEDEILGIIEASGVPADPGSASDEFQVLAIPDDDPILAQTKSLLFKDGYAGVVFTGPPGTSKSWYAIQVAIALTGGDPKRLRKIQFHSSYQYENFVEGFVPNSAGTGFELRAQVMLNIADEARDEPTEIYVVLIDELSRSDPARVFGELLTYMEPTRRDEEFTLASGRTVSIPPNIVFLATMNSRDKNVTAIDDAFDRRMAKISFEFRLDTLGEFLAENRVDDALSERIRAFASWVQDKHPLGHTFWRSVRDPESLARLWNAQLRFIFEKRFQYEPDVIRAIRDKFVEITGVDLG